MSLITRCPACGTMFKVVPDQLRISEGWVRCGHCSEVFDATASMQAEGVIPLEPEHTSPDALSDSQAPVEDFESSLNTEVGDSASMQPPDSALLEAEARALRETPLDRPFALMRPDVASAEPALEAPSNRSFPARQSGREPEPEPELHDLSFVRQARAKELWRHPGMRFLLVLVMLVLAAALTIQYALHDRDRLAATEPQLRPWLSRLCGPPFNCTIAPPRQIDALAIDSSSFNKLRGDAYRLSFTLKNQAALQVAMPALELTLTDGQDQPVLRRVLMPADYAPNPPVINGASDWSGSLALSVASSGSAGRIAGYRLLAFYP